ncbi:hypothetical protein GCK72_003302 [Caenorhabditis remanei]|uniref:F-box domain-containing protein n=1 Tax=Caenorhabditis remanei TaxID=31234 RepID=A0A6A5HX00_CAERE|nr:hypothetical protein GCK72_003302 [Caenorhabditis remanei]KAF1771476.1 hypothetical protein GCK72_003302 [Caenorhabditis remanei]
MTTPFRLFSLPFVPLKQVLDNIGPQGIIILSLCSRRSKSIAVTYRGPSKDVRLTLDFGLWDCVEDSNHSCMNILLSVEETGNLPMDETLETVRIGNFLKVPVKMEKHIVKGVNLITYWKDRITGLAAIGDCAREIFNKNISEVCIYDKQEKNWLRRAAAWVRNSQETFQILRCNFVPKNHKDLDFILENSNCTEKLFLCVRPCEHYSPAKLPNFRIDSLHVYYSYWIKQNHLLTMDCKYIWLQDSKLSSQDLNVFLKHWMAGGCSKLEQFRAFVEEPTDYEIVFDGVQFTERENDVARGYVNEESKHYTLRGGFDIKRISDNITATILNNGENSRFFLLIVWPDFAGNPY